MKRKFFIASMVLVFSFFIGVTGCADPSVESVKETKESEKVILRLAGGDTGVPNPFKHLTRGPGMSKMQMLYDSLIEKDENGDIPWLAKKWEVSEDGKVYTFHLEQDAFWHDGIALTAEDVAFTFEYYRDHPPVSNDLMVNGKYIISKTKVIDEYTVELILNEFDNTYFTKIGFSRIIPKHIWENVEDPVSYEGEGYTVGSGPYTLESYNAQQGTYRYIAFENYWGLTPAAKAIEWVPVSDNVLAFENGEIDLINVSADVLSRYEGNEDYTVKKVPSYHSYRLMMNMEQVDELKDNNIRKAIAYAIDRQELVDKISRGSATISSMGYVPSNSPWYNSNIEKYDSDIEKSKELLDGKTYSFKLLIGNTAEESKIAELMKINLDDVGIDLSVESIESKARDNAVKTGEYELLLINSGGMGGDPDFLRSIYGSQSNTAALNQSNIRGYNNIRLNELADSQGIEPDRDKRKEIIFEMQKIIADDVPMIMLHGAVDNFVYRHDKYDGWMFRYDHNKTDHNKLSYLIRE